MSDTTSFSAADLYTCVKDCEDGITATTPEMAIREYRDEQGFEPDGQPVVIYGYKRTAVTNEWIQGEAASLAAKLADDFDDEFGGEHSSGDFESAMVESVRMAVADIAPYWSDMIGEREYSADEVLTILGEERKR
jgi:hypothetical protein